MSLLALAGFSGEATGRQVWEVITSTAGRDVSVAAVHITPRSIPAALAGATALVLAVSVISSLIPALRATRVDPTVALREE